MRKGDRIKKIERNLSFKRIRSQKKYSIMILSITILACILMQTGFQISAGIKNTFLENRKEMYGEWERALIKVDSRSEEIVNGNPFIAEKGRIAVYGVLGGEYIKNSQANIGTISETAWNLGRLSLKEGRLPQNETEIAMEYSMLAALGYEECLGEQIELEVVPAVKDIEEQPSITRVYTLCGIIKDYQINWEVSTTYRFPTGIVTEEGAKKIGNALETHMLIKAEQGQETVYVDLENSALPCKIVENTNKGISITENIPFEKTIDSICVLIAGAVISILFVVISQSIGARKDFWNFLHALGMEKKQMYQMIFWEAIIYFGVSMVVGTIGGILLYQVILPQVELILGREMIDQISYQSVFMSFFSCAAIIAISYIFSSMRLHKILKGEIRKTRKNFNKKADKITKFTPFAVVIHQWRYTFVRKIFQIILISTTILITGIGWFELGEKLENLERFKQSTGNGYYLDTDGIPNLSGVQKYVVHQIGQIDGVEDIEAYYSSDFYETEFTIDFSGHSDSKYLQEIVKTEQSYGQDVSIENISLHILGIEEWKDMERFLENISEGNVNREEFEQGEFCILVLAPLEKMSEGYRGNIFEEEFQESFLVENTINVGEELNITYHKSTDKQTEKQIQVDAILRTSKSKDVRSPYPAGSGIYIIAGSAFWKTFEIDTVDNYYQKVKILVSEEADVLDTEKHILRTLKSTSTVNLTNYHEMYKLEQQELYTFIGMYSVFLVFYMIFVFVILYQMREVEALERKRNTEIFRLLGMEESFIKEIRRMEGILVFLISVLVSTIVLVCYYFAKN